MSTTREPRQWKRTACPHCEEKVSQSTYYHHREKHYNVHVHVCSGKWTKGSDVNGAHGKTATANFRESSESASTSSCSVEEENYDSDGIAYEGMQPCPPRTLYIYHPGW